MRRRIFALTAIHLGLAAVLAAAASSVGMLGPPALAVLPFAAAIAIVGSLQMNVELGRHACWVTMVEAVVVAMLLHLTPSGVVLGAVLGEALVCAWQRQAPSKLVYNVGSAATAAMLSVLVFNSLRGETVTGGATLVAALGAACCYATATHASTSAVLAVVEGRRFASVFTASLAPVGIASVISATIGLVAMVLAAVSPAAVVLVVPLLVVMVAETRRVATHRAEHLRFERLYAASSRTGGLTSLPEVMGTLAEEARSLVTGAVGLCCTMGGDGVWSGVVVEDDKVAPAPAAAISAILALAGSGTGTANTAELASDVVPAEVRALLPSMESLVVARSADGAAATPILLGVLRQLSADDGAGARAQVLGAFIGHAALTVANARLYADVEAALAHQVDLNRQKDDFVSAVSHELRTPLAAMIGSVLTLRRMEDRLRPDQRVTLTDLAFRQAKRLQRLIEELLTLATVENGERPRADELVNLEPMVDDIAAELRSQRVGEELPMIRFSDAGSGSIRTSAEKLRQVLSNLIENACKYAPGSAIDVKVERHGDTVKVLVADGGPGIQATDRERVFERFVQLDQTSTRSQGGTGLGLYLCRQVAVLLGGTLTLSDTAGGGCSFILTLPAAPGGVVRDGRLVDEEGERAAATTSMGAGR